MRLNMQQFGKHLMQTHKMLFLSSGATVGGAPQGSDLKRLEFHYKTDILLKILAEGVLKVDFETNFVEENSLTLSILLSWEASVFPTRKKKEFLSKRKRPQNIWSSDYNTNATSVTFPGGVSWIKIKHKIKKPAGYLECQYNFNLWFLLSVFFHGNPAK